jgi:hypothetical protein
MVGTDGGTSSMPCPAASASRLELATSTAGSSRAIIRCSNAGRTVAEHSAGIAPIRAAAAAMTTESRWLSLTMARRSPYRRPAWCSPAEVSSTSWASSATV